MKQFLALVLLAVMAYGGYLFYTRSRVSPPSVSRLPTGINISQSPESLAGIGKVLGETTSRLWESGVNLLNGATDGQAEPVINKAVSDLQSRVKDLPKEQYEKVKYEFCKDVVTNYEEVK